MKTGKGFPVAIGSVLTLSCNGGYLLSGAEHVTCTRGTAFEYDEDVNEPKCGKTAMMNLNL